MTSIIPPELTDEEKAHRAKLLASEEYANLWPKRKQSPNVQQSPSTTETSDAATASELDP